jgi:hypothetical protein
MQLLQLPHSRSHQQEARRLLALLLPHWLREAGLRRGWDQPNHQRGQDT